MDLPVGWSTGTVPANGIDLHYYRAGEGPPIVTAHGWADDGQRWLRLGSDLADEFTVIAYDARGHGRSDAPETGYDIDTRVADLVGLVAGLDLDDPVLLGHSMGAATVAWAAADHPDLPRAVILEDPARFRRKSEVDYEEAREEARRSVRETKELSIEARIEEVYGGDPEDEHCRRLAGSFDRCSLHVAKVAQEHPLVVEAFDEIDCPTLVLRSDLEVAERVADLDAADWLADGRLVHTPNAGHYVFLDAYDAAFAELRAFLHRV